MKKYYIILVTQLINIISENVVLDFAQTAQPNITKLAFFYNVDVNNKSFPINQSDLNTVTSYLTINEDSTKEGTVIKYYKYPYFRTQYNSKYYNTSWIGAHCMNEKVLEQWIKYSQSEIKTPTFVWKFIKKECSGTSNTTLLYDYSTLLPASIPSTFMYVFTWKEKYNDHKCIQSTFSLTYDKIVCYAFQGIDCSPPFSINSI